MKTIFNYRKIDSKCTNCDLVLYAAHAAPLLCRMMRPPLRVNARP